MATRCQTAARSGSGERQNIGAVNSFESKKRGAVSTIFCEIHDIHYMKCLVENWSYFYIQLCIEKV